MLDLLVGRIDDAVATVFRQIALNRFEHAVHTGRREEGELPIERISELWSEEQRRMLGDAVEVTDGYGIWWSYVPHFIQTPGYVYAYSFGYLFSLAIYRRYLDEGEALVEPYLDLLRAGGSAPPAELASRLGFDIGDPGFWSAGLDAVGVLVDEAEQLAAAARRLECSSSSPRPSASSLRSKGRGRWSAGSAPSKRRWQRRGRSPRSGRAPSSTSASPARAGSSR